MEFLDTIVAIATPAGLGGLGVLRLSGPQSLSIADQLIRKKTKFSLQEAPSHTLHHAFIDGADHIIDEVVIAIFRTPRSYTGEDVVEISCHGSPVVLKEVLNLCEKKGARQANPGEFTQRAYMNGKLDLAQAEAVVDLIHAQSSKARLQATEQLRGVLSKRIYKIRDQLLETLAQLEANLDFVEEDIPPLAKSQLQRELVVVFDDLNQLISTSAQARILRQGIRVVLVGRPNVGKSSLFNSLLAFDRAIVSETPGTTRDTIEEHLEWGGFPIVLVDTAGLRSTADPVEEKGLDRTRQAQELADVILFLVDGSCSLNKEDEAIAATLSPEKTITLINKADVARVLSEKDFSQWKYKPLLFVSALRSEGLGDVQKAVVEKGQALQRCGADNQETPVVMNERHLGHLKKALVHIQNTQQALSRNKTEESISMDLRQALHELGGITGEAITDDLLSKIFSRFCIGK